MKYDPPAHNVGGHPPNNVVLASRRSLGQGGCNLSPPRGPVAATSHLVYDPLFPAPAPLAC